MTWKATADVGKVDAAARIVRSRNPHGIGRAELAVEIGVNPSTWRTAYEELLLARNPDITKQRAASGIVYVNDGRKTGLLLSYWKALERGDRDFAETLRERWQALSPTTVPLQQTLDGV